MGDVVVLGKEAGGFITKEGKEGSFIGIRKGDKVELLEGKDRASQQALIRLARGEPSISAVAIAGFDEASLFLSKKLLRKTGLEDTILAKEFDVSIGEFALFGFFNPALQTGAVAKAVTKTAKAVSKSKIQSAKKLRKILEKTSDEDLINFRNVQRDFIKKNTAIDEAEKIRRLERLDAVIFEARSGERIILADGSIDLNVLQRIKSQAVKKPPRTRKVLDEIILQKNIPKIRGAGQITSAQINAERLRLEKFPSIVQPSGKGRSAFQGLGSHERTDTAFGIANKFSQGSKLKQSIFLKQQTGQSPLSLNAQRLILREQTQQLSRTLQGLGLSTLQTNKQLSLQRSLLLQGASQSQISKQLSKQRSLLLSGTAQALRQEQLLRQRLRLRGASVRARLRRPTRKLRKLFRPIVPLLPKRRKKQVTRKGVLGNGFNKFDVFVRRKGLIKRITNKPIRGKSRALDFGAFRVSRNLRASFGIKKTGRAGFKKIPLEITGFLKRNRNQFRKAKSPQLKKLKFLVEKRKFRLDSPLEKKRIQQARRLAKPFKNKVPRFLTLMNKRK